MFQRNYIQKIIIKCFKTDENELEIPKEKYISPEKRQQIIDELNKMEYQKIINLLDNTSNKPSKFRTKIWVEINDYRNGVYDKNNLKFKTAMLNASLCDYSDAYILV